MWHYDFHGVHDKLNIMAVLHNASCLLSEDDRHGMAFRVIFRLGKNLFRSTFPLTWRSQWPGAAGGMSFFIDEKSSLTFLSEVHR